MTEIEIKVKIFKAIVSNSQNLCDSTHFITSSGADYIQDNPKIKQLPDKCIDALSRWVDSLNKEENKDGSNR